ncbi:S-layer homology domain-containing protein, partial [Patescibacteria group bacterium]
MKKLIFLTLALFILLASSAYAYSDVDSSTDYNEAIDYITDLEIVEGYDDGTYRPDVSIIRAEFTKILVEAKNGEEPTGYTETCFNDFPAERWFTSYVCYAKSEGIISGYPDGSFGPANNINLAEASKILVNVFEIETITPQGGEWYSVYIETLGAQGYIPSSFEYINDEVTRGEMAEMIYRIMEERH